MLRTCLFFCLLLAATPAVADTDCSPAAITAARTQFRPLYAAKEYAKARDTLALALECFADDPKGVPAASVLSDLAIAAYKAGDDSSCIAALQAYAPSSRGYRQRVSGLPEPLKRAIWFNLTLCTGMCNIVDAKCQSIRTAFALQKLVKGEFATPACPFRARSGSIALPDQPGQCLTILPPHRKLKWGDYTEADPQIVCPRLGLLRDEGGMVRTTEIPLPKDSWLRDLETCCVKPGLSIAPDGRFRLSPEENPPEGCVSGHRTLVVEEVYALDNGKLRLVRKVREGVY
jgi:hypothetical protein